MKKILYMIGASLVIVSIAIAIFLLRKGKKKHNEYSDYKKPDGKQFPAEDIALTKVTPIQEETKYEDIKSSAIRSMYSRHEGAATIIKDSVETIHENVKVSESTNNEIDEVSVELDKMLRED